jgi:hypothetical protein
MSHLKHKKNKRWHNPTPWDDTLFFERAEYLMANVIDRERGGGYEIADLFMEGYPIENLNRLFDCRDISVLLLAIEVCYELRKIAKPYIDRVAELMNIDDRLKRDYGICWLADYADENNELADWMILSSLEHEYESTALTAMNILSIIDFGQLRGAKNYLTRYIPNSQHINAIDFYMDNYNNERRIYDMLDSNCSIMKKYATALGLGYFINSLSIREKAFMIDDDVIKLFVQEKFKFKKDLH